MLLFLHMRTGWNLQGYESKSINVSQFIALPVPRKTGVEYSRDIGDTLCVSVCAVVNFVKPDKNIKSVSDQLFSLTI